eukprot:1189848-Prorocentrum_minimum.AAC.2
MNSACLTRSCIFFCTALKPAARHLTAGSEITIVRLRVTGTRQVSAPLAVRSVSAYASDNR